MWKRSSRCDNDLCLLVSVGSRTVWVGDSTDDPAGTVTVLSVPRPDWAGFVAELRAGRWDR